MSLFVRRRRVWVRATSGADGATVVEVAGLAKTEAGDVEDDVDALVLVLDTAGSSDSGVPGKEE